MWVNTKIQLLIMLKNEKLLIHAIMVNFDKWFNLFGAFKINLIKIEIIGL